MAGRGVTVAVEFDGSHFELHVAGHAPLYILMDELTEKTGVHAELQSLVLIDPEDETDSRLLDDEELPLYTLGLRDGSRLLLTALEETPDFMDPADEGGPDPPGVCPDADTELAAQLFSLDQPEGSPRAKAPRALNARPSVYRRKLDTPIQPNRANHSFNGVMFDVKPKGPFEVVVSSIWVRLCFRTQIGRQSGDCLSAFCRGYFRTERCCTAWQKPAFANEANIRARMVG